MERVEEQVRGSKGRCAIARVRIAPGSIVLQPTRAVAALSVVACNWCFRSPDDDNDAAIVGVSPATDGVYPAKLRRCGGCKRLKYCSSTCQQLDWTRGRHARECGAYKRIPVSVRDRALQTLLLVARLAAQLYISGDASSEQERAEVEQLRAHYDDHTANKLQQYREMAQLVLVLLSRFKLSDPERARLDTQAADHMLLERVVGLFCRVNCNAFTVSSAACAPRALGVFPRGALFNHSCSPNCVVSFQAQRMVVRAITDVPAGDELTISYVELLESTDKRRRALADSYFFYCDCERCKDSERDGSEDLYLDGHACAARSCSSSGVVVFADGAVAGTCHVCGTEHRIERKHELEAECAAIEQQLLEPSLVDATATWRLYERLRTLLVDELALHARNARLGTLWRELGTFMLNASERIAFTPSDNRTHTTALALFTRELSATDWVLPTLKLPPRGLLHFQLGKLVYYGESINSAATTSGRPDAVVQRARTHFQHALSILSCAYGADDALVRTVQAHLEELQWAHRQHQESS